MNENTASQHAKAQVFVNNLSSIPTFLSNSSYRCDVLEVILKHRLSKVTTTRWNYNIKTVNSVYEKWEKFIDVFEKMDKCLRSTTFSKASYLRYALLIIFHKLLLYADLLYNQIY